MESEKSQGEMAHSRQNPSWSKVLQLLKNGLEYEKFGQGQKTYAVLYPFQMEYMLTYIKWIPRNRSKCVKVTEILDKVKDKC